jgi:S1-C subfamily serine protease
VIEVRSDLPAARAGIEPQDLLVAVEGRSVAGGPDGLRPLEQPGAPLLVTLRRDGRARVTVLERVVAERTR